MGRGTEPPQPGSQTLTSSVPRPWFVTSMGKYCMLCLQERGKASTAHLSHAMKGAVRGPFQTTSKTSAIPHARWSSETLAAHMPQVLAGWGRASVWAQASLAREPCAFNLHAASPGPLGQHHSSRSPDHRSPLLPPGHVYFKITCIATGGFCSSVSSRSLIF